MTQQYENWSYDEFLTFFLISAANADLEIKEEEKEFILSKVDEGIFNKVKNKFDKNSDYECLQIIQSFKGKYYQSGKDVKRIYADIINLLQIDETYNQMERAFMMLMKRVIV